MKTTEELKNLLYKNETVADAAPDAIAAAQDFCEGYKTFLDNAKTEREATAYSEKLLTAAAAVVVGAQVADAGLFKHGHGAQVEARRVDVGNIQVEALLEVLRADGRGQHALFPVDGVDLGAGGIARAGHKLLIAVPQRRGHRGRSAAGIPSVRSYRGRR